MVRMVPTTYFPIAVVAPFDRRSEHRFEAVGALPSLAWWVDVVGRREPDALMVEDRHVEAQDRPPVVGKMRARALVKVEVNPRHRQRHVVHPFRVLALPDAFIAE